MDQRSDRQSLGPVALAARVLNDSAPERLADDRRARMHLQQAAYRLHVILYRARTAVDEQSDLLVAEATGEMADDDQVDFRERFRTVGFGVNRRPDAARRETT
jgi:hypothetical protein